MRVESKVSAHAKKTPVNKRVLGGRVACTLIGNTQTDRQQCLGVSVALPGRAVSQRNGHKMGTQKDGVEKEEEVWKKTLGGE